MKKTILFLAATVITATCFQSCKDDENRPNTTELTLKLGNPNGLDGAVVYSNLQAVFTERNTGTKTTSTDFINDMLLITLPEGAYDIAVTGEIAYQLNGIDLQSEVKGSKESNAVIGEKTSIDLPMILVLTHNDFLISEIFFTGTLTPQGKQYNGDKYIKIYNNTDSVLYADGLVIGQSDFLTVTKQAYRPNIMSEAVAVSSLIQIPGTGEEYAVNPGDYLLIADNAVNHLENNSNSFNLEKADLEWYSETSGGEIDNPSVPNMVNLYDGMIMHNRGFTSYIIARIPINNTAYLKDYTYAYEYDFVFGGISYPMDGECYKIPNEWIVDAVNLSVESEFQWIVTSPSLDMGWTYCGKVDQDPERYGKSVRRKVLSSIPGKMDILQDTNNSSNDFDPEATPSLIKE